VILWIPGFIGSTVMDKIEAKQILSRELEKYRGRPYDELVKSIGDSIVYETTGASGAVYQLEITVLWDGRPGGDVRVIASVDDGGWSAFTPLSGDFIKNPAGDS
jgi:hypothetical protein